MTHAAEGHVPMSVSMSVLIHAGALGGWLYLQQTTAKTPLKVISNVDLLIQVRGPTLSSPRPAASRPPKLDAWNFLRMALPAVPKARPLDVNDVPVQHKKALDVPKVADKGRLKKELLADKLVDVGKSHRLSQLDASKIEPARHARPIATAPKLEEIGMRKASQSKIDMALASEREGRLKALDAGPATEAPRPSRRVQVMDTIAEAAPAAEKPTKLARLADMLTSEETSMPTPRPMLAAPKQSLEDTVAAPTAPKRAEALGLKKKAIEIEGPLSNRKVVAYQVPAFPKWLADKGIQEAIVKIRFNVSPAGDVLPTMRIDLTSGYGDLDRLAMDALKAWRFEKTSEDSGNQWGVITFRFELD